MPSVPFQRNELGDLAARTTVLGIALDRAAAERGDLRRTAPAIAAVGHALPAVALADERSR